MMSVAWGIIATLNKHNKKILVFTGSIAILLGIVTISFFANQIMQNN